MPEDCIQSVPVQSNAASQRGVAYQVANGAQIPNLGEKVLQGVMEGSSTGVARKIKTHICAVNKPLLSVSKLVKAGNTVVFSPEGSYIQDTSTQELIWLVEEQGMYNAKM